MFSCWSAACRVLSLKASPAWFGYIFREDLGEVVEVEELQKLYWSLAEMHHLISEVYPYSSTCWVLARDMEREIKLIES